MILFRQVWFKCFISKKKKNYDICLVVIGLGNEYKQKNSVIREKD